MTLLDRFRTQPPEKHADPGVRLAHVAELPVEARDAIAAFAQEDGDPRVRRAAVGKLMAPDVLGVLAQSDPDESVRAKALEMLRDLASEAFEGIGETDSLAAVEALRDVRTLAQVAKASINPTVALRALSRVPDPRLLGSIARHAATDAARLGALAALTDGAHVAEVLAVALNSEFKDTATSAVDVLSDRATLEQVANKSRNKNAVKRARVLIREIDDRVARQAAEQAALEAEARLAAHTHSEQPPMSMDASIDSTPLSTPSAPDTALAHDPRLEPPADAVAPAAPGLEPVVSAVLSAEEESRAAEAAAAREAERQARLVAIAEEAAQVADVDDLDAARKRFHVLGDEWRRMAAAGVDETLASRFTEADARFSARDAAAREADLRARREALARMHNLLGRCEQLLTQPQLSLKAADRALRDVRAALSAVPPLPGKTDYEEVTTRLKAVQEALNPKVVELREADEWQKWANVTLQEQLCAKMEALNALTDADAIVKEVRDLQQQWRLAADVPRDKADVLWRRFKAAHDIVWARCEERFAEQARERAENLAKKVSLCEQVEAIADSTSWIQTADAIKKLQADWKTIGPVSRGREKAIWDRFRSACDRFFTRRHEDLAQRKGMWSENLAKKDALCARAEALAESTEWEAAAAEIKRLQAEWKTIGPVKKSRSEAVWQRFRTACDRFFDRYAHRHDLARAERVAAREAICAELEGLSSLEADAEAPADLMATVRTLRGRWQQEVAARGVDPDRARALEVRFGDAFAKVIGRWPAVFNGTDLDPNANQKRMEQLVKRLEDLASSLAGPAAAVDQNVSPATRLAAMLKDALAANTIGGKADDDQRWRAAAEDVRQAQAAWARLGPVPDEVRRPLADRFQRAARRIADRADSALRSAPSNRAPGRAVGSRPAGGGKPDGRPRVERHEPASVEK